jgi:hypothetical protein
MVKQRNANEKAQAVASYKSAIAKPGERMIIDIRHKNLFRYQYVVDSVEILNNTVTVTDQYGTYTINGVNVATNEAVVIIREVDDDDVYIGNGMVLSVPNRKIK